ncbi:MAG: hypothetical protein JXR95_07945, partial [Deltaproteobacteria bacterium]|nr:hypothetical protein [Deltaproteobacteria bacterium]
HGHLGLFWKCQQGELIGFNSVPVARSFRDDADNCDDVDACIVSTPCRWHGHLGSTPFFIFKIIGFQYKNHHVIIKKILPTEKIRKKAKIYEKKQ